MSYLLQGSSRARAARRRHVLAAGGCATYEIITSDMGQSIVCCCCGKISHHPDDVDNLYCGFCHEFHSKEQPDASVSGDNQGEGGVINQDKP